jgi:hypothetical protein
MAPGLTLDSVAAFRDFALFSRAMKGIDRPPDVPILRVCWH